MRSEAGERGSRLLRPAVWFAPSATLGDLARIAVVFAATTLALWVIAYAAPSVFPENKIGSFHYTKNRALDVWARWDTSRYATIAQRGYTRHASGDDDAPWFPLYPYLMRWLAPSPRLQAPVGHAISLLSFFLLLFVLFDIVALRQGRDVANYAVLFISIFPSALYFRAVYAEALFTLLVLLAYRAYLNGQFVRVGLYGALAAMTRVPGIMLLPAFAATAAWEVARGQRRFRPAMLGIGLIAAGLALVMFVQWSAYGDPLAFVHRPGLHNRQVVIPGISVLRDFRDMYLYWNFATGKIGVNILIDDIAAVLAVVASLYCFRRYGFLAGAVSIALLLPPLMSNVTIGMIRYVLPVFYIQVLLAELAAKRPWFGLLWTYASALLLAFYTISFACWYWTA